MLRIAPRRGRDYVTAAGPNSADGCNTYLVVGNARVARLRVGSRQFLQGSPHRSIHGDTFQVSAGIHRTPEPWAKLSGRF